MIGTLSRIGDATGKVTMSNVLIVEDDYNLGKLWVTTLNNAGYEATRVTTGEAALDQLAQKPYDLMLLDLHMPAAAVDGLGVLRRYREVAPHTAVIVITGWGNMLDLELAINSDVDKFLEKPVDIADLLAAIEPYVRRFAASGFVIDQKYRRASFRGREINELTATEYDLLALFVRYGRLAFDEIAWMLRGEEWSYDRARRSYNAHLSRLRDKLDGLTGRETIRHDPRSNKHFLVNVDEDIT